MTPPDAHDDRLDELRRRWQEDPGSRLFLQLAEEYRHRERHAEAREVLEKGLAEHPNQVSGLVALGRVHLEMGQPEDASEALEKALAIDATNAVAMKLAVEAFLQMGERDQARQRLELYKLLNATDSEIEPLQARVEGRQPPASGDGEAAGDSVPEPGPGAPEPSANPAAGAEEAPRFATGGSPTAAWPEPGEESGEAEEPSGVSAEELSTAPPDGAEPFPAAGETEPEPRSTSAPFDARTEGDEPTAAGFAADRSGARPEPFGDLSAPIERRRYLEGLGAEGIFPLELEPEPATEPPATEPPATAEPHREPQTAAQDAAAEVPGAEGPVPPPLPPDTDRPTVTLGNLYLDQGHPDEAVGIFEAVLQRDPGNEAARNGLDRARSAAADEPRAHPFGLEPEESAAWEEEAPPLATPPAAEAPVSEAGAASSAETSGGRATETAPAPPLTAADLLADVAPDRPRKQALLHAYLDRLRGHQAS